MRFAALVLCLVLGLGSGAARAGDVSVAVAANFGPAARALGDAFAAETGHATRLSVGSTGTLYAQITQGAPYEVFLAADRERPARLVADGLGAPGAEAFTYAFGRLVLYGREPGLVHGPDVLRAGTWSRLALANPKTAPYGAAAVEVLRRLGAWDDVEPRLVRGNNVAQALSFVATGNAELGFVAFAQLVGRDGGSRWIVPAELHAPIAQDALLLERGTTSEAARAFVAFLRGPAARGVIVAHGYGIGN